MGSVYISVDGTVVGNPTVGTNGTASYTVAGGLSLGNHTIQADYAGASTPYEGSSATPATYVVYSESADIRTEVLSGRRTVASAGIVLAITARQVNRLLIQFCEDDGGGLIHKGRRQSSNYSASAGVREYVLELVKSKYADFGPTLAIEVPLAKRDIQIGRQTLRTWMLEEGFLAVTKQRSNLHQPRLRREGYGELIQIDGRDHRSFEQRGEPCTLLVFIDGATSKLMQLRLVPIEHYLLLRSAERKPQTHGCPTAFHSDEHTVLDVSRPNAKVVMDYAVRPNARRAQHRDPVRELEPGEGADWKERTALRRIGS